MRSVVSMANFSTTDKHRWTRIKNQIPPEVGRKPRFKSSNFGLQMNVWKIIILHMGTMDHPIWDLYNLQRSCRYNTKLYSYWAEFLLRIDFWSDVVTACFAGTSAIAGFTFWTTTAWGSRFWVVGTACAAVIMVVKPISKLNDKIKTYTDLCREYRDLESDCKIIAIKVKNESAYTSKHVDELIVTQEKARQIEKGIPPSHFSVSKRKSIQAEVNEELPLDDFYIPPR